MGLGGEGDVEEGIAEWREDVGCLLVLSTSQPKYNTESHKGSVFPTHSIIYFGYPQTQSTLSYLK